MDLKKLLVPLLIAGALVLAASGCGKQDGAGEPAAGEESEAYATRAAMLGGPDVEYVNPGQYKCPVTGKKIKADFYVDTGEGRVYLYSREAVQKFKDSPDKYLSAVKQQE